MDRTVSFQNQHCTAMRADGAGTLELLLSRSGRNGGEPPNHADTGRNLYPQAFLWGSPHGCRIAESRLLGQSKTGSAFAAFDGTGSGLSEAETEPGRAGSQDISVSAKRIDNQSGESSLEHRELSASVHKWKKQCGFRGSCDDFRFLPTSAGKGPVSD